MKNNNNPTTKEGWTLRDEVAMRAMQVYITTEKDAPDGEDWDEWQCKMAYNTADAFLKVRLETES